MIVHEKRKKYRFHLNYKKVILFSPKKVLFIISTNDENILVTTYLNFFVYHFN